MIERITNIIIQENIPSLKINFKFLFSALFYQGVGISLVLLWSALVIHRWTIWYKYKVWNIFGERLYLNDVSFPLKSVNPLYILKKQIHGLLVHCEKMCEKKHKFIPLSIYLSLPLVHKGGGSIQVDPLKST